MNPSFTHSELERLLDQQEWLQRLSRRLLGNGPDADDLAQETLHRALRSGFPGRPENGSGNLRGWLTTVARRLLKERHRTEQRRRAREERVAPSEAMGDSTSEVVERANLRRCVLDEVLGLDEPEREAVVLRYLEGLSYEAVAERQSITSGTARKRVSRGIDRLRSRLDDSQGGRLAWVSALAPFAMDGAQDAAVFSKAALATGATAGSSSWVGSLSSASTKLLAAGFLLAVAGWSWLAFQGRSDPATIDLEPAPLASSERALVQLEDLTVAASDVALERRVEEEPEAAEPVVAAFELLPPEKVGTLVLRLSWSDGSAAKGVNARLMPWGANDAFLQQRWARTDSSGQVRIEQLAPGRVGIYLDRTGGGTAVVEANRVTVHDVTIPEGVRVSGRVLDPEGQPVSRANVCLSGHGNTTEGFVVTTSDSEGRYELRDVSHQRWISARHPGWAPSSQEYTKASPGEALSVDLRLRGTSGALAGRVFDPEGSAVAGARVAVRLEAPPLQARDASKQDTRADRGRWREHNPLPFDLLTDAAGTFYLPDAGAGVVEVQVRAGNYAPWSTSARIQPGETLDLEIGLKEGCALEGTITYADGTPAEGVDVLQGRYGSFASFRGRSNAQGEYVIHGMPSGRLELRASKRDRGQVRTSVLLESDRVNRLDLRLVEGRTVRGVVVDERGLPLAGWYVSDWSAGRGYTRRKPTDEQGKFVLPDLKDDVESLSVGPPDIREVGISKVLHGILAEQQGDLRIVVPDEVRPTASLRVHARVDGKKAPGTLQVWLQSKSGAGTRELYPDEDGLIELKRLRPGDYRLQATHPDLAKTYLNFSVAPEEALELEDWDLTQGGRVRMVFTGDVPFLRVGWLDARGQILEHFDGTSGVVEAGPLPVGTHRFRLQAPGLAAQEFQVEISLDETTEVRIATRPGTTRIVEVSAADGGSLPPHALLIYDQQGTLVLTMDTLRLASSEAAFERSIFGLTAGRFLVVAEATDGRRAEGELVVANLDISSEVALTLSLDWPESVR